MGNASSFETQADATPTQLKEELAEMHRSLQALSVCCSSPPVLLPNQILLDGVIVDTRKDVQVLLGPVVGKIEFQRARILLEVDRRAIVTAFVSTLDAMTNSMRVEQGEAPIILHLGGQVAMERMFDQAVQLLLLYADGLSGDGVDRMNWLAMEEKATEILRSAYRSQWTLSPDLQFALANAGNLMMWSDGDIYPQFSTREEFFIDHEQPTLRMQVIRTVTRCARRLFHEYQRQLWDDNMRQLIEREVRIYQL
ncbi:hypothetical protein BBO99_00005672 [Phytophthora kernoviae]|uniref:Uncharacterized protein n=1 Tax=Phytophthora kernoviae TaxID=325452 RepID=A0A3R7HVU5_9STRA|nr:hypothetical protein BBI17_005665 [Phytophthora kernoviae]RLN78852.1 hypothetical protein BBO99_00005672 [Phytophthora kernoviae]